MTKTFDHWLPRIKALHDAALTVSVHEKDENGKWQPSDAGPDAAFYEITFVDTIENVMACLGYDIDSFGCESIDYNNDALMSKLLQIYGMAEGTPMVLLKEGMLCRENNENVLEIIKGRLRDWGMEFNDTNAQEIFDSVKMLKSIQTTVNEAAELLGLTQKHPPQLHALEAQLGVSETSRGASPMH